MVRSDSIWSYTRHHVISCSAGEICPRASRSSASISTAASVSSLSRAADRGRVVVAHHHHRADGPHLLRTGPAIATATRPSRGRSAVEIARAVHGPVTWLSQISPTTHTSAPHSGHPRATRTRRRSDSLIPGGYTTRRYRVTPKRSGLMSIEPQGRSPSISRSQPRRSRPEPVRSSSMPQVYPQRRARLAPRTVSLRLRRGFLRHIAAAGTL